MLQCLRILLQCLVGYFHREDALIRVDLRKLAQEPIARFDYSVKFLLAFRVWFGRRIAVIVDSKGGNQNSKEGDQSKPRKSASHEMSPFAAEAVSSPFCITIYP